MLNATTQIRRAVALAGAVVAVVASSASARVPDARPVSTPSHGAAAAAPTKADIAARREARVIEAWRAANPPTIIEVSSPDDGGLDLPSVGVGAAIPLTVVLIEVAGRWVLRRRRDTEVRHQAA